MTRIPRPGTPGPAGRREPGYAAPSRGSIIGPPPRAYWADRHWHDDSSDERDTDRDRDKGKGKGKDEDKDGGKTYSWSGRRYRTHADSTWEKEYMHIEVSGGAPPKRPPSPPRRPPPEERRPPSKSRRLGLYYESATHSDYDDYDRHGGWIYEKEDTGGAWRGGRGDLERAKDKRDVWDEWDRHIDDGWDFVPPSPPSPPPWAYPYERDRYSRWRY